jgi:hypothetical protein
VDYEAKIATTWNGRRNLPPVEPMAMREVVALFKKGKAVAGFHVKHCVSS